MTVVIKESYKSPRELDLAEVNRLLSAGLIETDCIAWTPGLENWVPLHEIPGIQMLAPPPLPSLIPASTVENRIPPPLQSKRTIHPAFAYFLPVGHIGRGVWLLRNFLHLFALGIIAFPLAGSENIIVNTLVVSWWILWIYLTLITTAKRLHDLNLSAWFCWIIFIPFVPLLLLFLSGSKGSHPTLTYFLPIGRIGRGNWFLRNLLHGLAIGIIASPFTDSENIIADTILASLGFLWLHLILITSAKRLHDLNVSAWFCWIVFIPFVPLFLLFLGGTKGSNKYGSKSGYSVTEQAASPAAGNSNQYDSDPSNAPAKKSSSSSKIVMILIGFPFLVAFIVAGTIAISAIGETTMSATEAKKMQTDGDKDIQKVPQSPLTSQSTFWKKIRTTSGDARRYLESESINPGPQKPIDPAPTDRPVPDSNQSGIFDAKRIYQDASPRIVKIEVMNDLGHPIIQGSGVALGPSMPKLNKNVLFSLDTGTDILTNYHVIENAKFIIVETANDKTLAANIVFFDRDSDLAIIRVPTSIVSREINISNSPEVGDKVAAIGHPLGLPLTISEGIISGAPNKQHGILRTTAAVSHGSSGGGLFDSAGNLIGIMVFGSVSNEAQNLNMAIWLDSDLTKTITRLRDGGSISGNDIWVIDHIVGFYKWDPCFFPDNWDSWKDTYRKNSEFADYIESTDKLNSVLNTIQTTRQDIINSKKLSKVQKSQLYKSLREEQSHLAPVIQHQYKTFPNDPITCLYYFDLVEDNGHKELLLTEWLNRWPTDMLLFWKAESFYIEEGNLDEAKRIILAIKDFISKPSENEKIMTDAWSRSQYEKYKIQTKINQQEAMSSFDEFLLLLSKRYSSDFLRYSFNSSSSTSQ